VTSSGVPRRRATLDNLLALQGETAAELIDGEIVEKATPGPEHGTAQLGLGAQLFGPFHRPPGRGGPGGWWLMTEVEVFYFPDETYRHDLVGWRRENVPAMPLERPVRVRPDWVAEVLSPSNASNDTVKKLRTLQRVGVPHYWLVDPERRTLTVLRWTPEGYLTVLSAAIDERVRAEPFDSAEIDLSVLFDLTAG
jgi:Uma2 family endonuclease